MDENLMSTMTSETPKILIVDDEKSIREPLARVLATHGFDVETAVDSAAARKAMKVTLFDLIVLDVMMPGETGLSLCQSITTETQVPVILLTALSEDEDRISGLNIGADDYLSKPFNPDVLVARINSVLRRVERGRAKPTSVKRKFGAWVIDLVKGELISDTGIIEMLSSGELNLMRVFLDHPNELLTRDQILGLTKGREAFAYERSIDIMVSRLRGKIEPNPASPIYIRTVWGGGYRFTIEAVTEE